MNAGGRIFLCALFLAWTTVAACGKNEDHPPPVGEPTATKGQSLIPVGKVQTPAGLFDEICVHEIPSGSRVDLDGTVTLNGHVVRRYGPCPTAQPVQVPPRNEHDPSPDGWVENTYATATNIGGLSFFNDIYTSWTVPPLPNTYESPNQLIFIFPGLQTYPTASILQPVLQFGQNGGAGGGDFWGISVWYVVGFSVYHTPLIQVSPGDHLTGEIYLYDYRPPYYQAWSLYLADSTNGTETSAIFNSDMTPFVSAVSAALEAYQLNNCNDYPTSGYVAFGTNLEVYQAGPNWYNFNQVYPSWGTRVNSVTPSCSYGVSINSYGTTLDF